MKKILTLLISLSLSIALTACSGNESLQALPETEKANASTPGSSAQSVQSGMSYLGEWVFKSTSVVPEMMQRRSIMELVDANWGYVDGDWEYIVENQDALADQLVAMGYLYAGWDKASDYINGSDSAVELGRLTLRDEKTIMIEPGDGGDPFEYEYTIVFSEEEFLGSYEADFYYDVALDRLYLNSDCGIIAGERAD